MSKVQAYLAYSSSTLSNYLAWAEEFGTALTALGWSKVSDTAAVTWSNITASTYVPTNVNPYGTPLYAGAFATATEYAGESAGNSGTFNFVTNGGVTWACILVNYLALTNVLPNTTNSWTVTSVTGTSSGSTVFTLTGTGVTSNQYVGFLFTISAYTGGSTANNGSWICTANTATSGSSFTVTLNTVTQVLGGGSAITTVTSSATAAAATSSSNTTYYNTGSISQLSNNAWYGLSVNTSGFNNASNNGNFTVSNSTNTTSGSPGGCIVVNNSAGLTETHAGTIIAQTVPSSDLYHWQPYNYEIWKTTDSASSTQPIYVKFAYSNSSSFAPQVVFAAGTGNTTGLITGNTPGEVLLGAGGSTSVGSTFECDFQGDTGSLSILLWRNGSAGLQVLLFVDRARDQYGNGLASFFNTGWLNINSSGTRFYSVFESGQGIVVGPFYTFPHPEPTGTTAVTSLAYAGMTPVLPVFPLPGYVANPCLQVVTMKSGDFSDGNIINAVLYGASHTYLMSKGIAVDGNSGSNTYVGIRWE